MEKVCLSLEWKRVEEMDDESGDDGAGEMLSSIVRDCQ